MIFIDFETVFDAVEIWALTNAVKICRIDCRHVQAIIDISKDGIITVKLFANTKTIKIKRGEGQGPSLYTVQSSDLTWIWKYVPSQKPI